MSALRVERKLDNEKWREIKRNSQFEFFLAVNTSVQQINNQVPAGIAPSGQMARQNLDWEGCDVIARQRNNCIRTALETPRFKAFGAQNARVKGNPSQDS
eukprot:scaffold12544_cov75-Skeletonema_dohrnii-CCMP3373.AAC.1